MKIKKIKKIASLLLATTISLTFIFNTTTVNAAWQNVTGDSGVTNIRPPRKLIFSFKINNSAYQI